MEIVILIAALVLLVSLYDYYTSKSWQQVTSSSRNDVVFGDRNKSYGAYQIRKDYNRNFVFILLGIVGTIGISYGAFRYFKAQSVSELVIPTDKYEFLTIDQIIPLDFDKPTPPAVDKQQSEPVKTDAFSELVVTETPVTTTVLTQDQLGDNPIGNTATEGKETLGTSTTIIDTEGGDGNGGGSTKIEEFVDKEAMFPGGIEAMKRYLSRHIKYPEIGLQTGAHGKAILRFVVGKDGKIENVTVARGVPGCPECDAEAIRVVKSMPQWTPAENKGKVVKSYFNLPVTFAIK